MGASTTLLTAVGADERGQRALERMRALDLTTALVQIVADSPTGAAIVKTDAEGNATFTIARPAAFDGIAVNDALLSRLQGLQPDWIYFGTLAMTSPGTEAILRRMVQRSPQARRFYDMNLRAGHWNLALVERLSGFATALKLNENEAEELSQLVAPETAFHLESFCRYWAETHGIQTICVTLGSKGCAVLHEGRFESFPGYEVRVADTVGAGDAFSAAFLHRLHEGWQMDRVASFANAVGALVASRNVATPTWDMDECRRLMAREALAVH
jgi:fructokinase